MVFNATFNNSSAILSVLLVEETGVLRENHRPAVNHNHDHDHVIYRILLDSWNKNVLTEIFFSSFSLLAPFLITIDELIIILIILSRTPLSMVALETVNKTHWFQVQSKNDRYKYSRSLFVCWFLALD